MIFKIIRPLVRDAANSLILLRCIIIYPQFFFLYWPQPIDALDTRILFSTLDMPWLCGPTASGYQRRVMRVRWMPLFCAPWLLIEERPGPWTSCSTSRRFSRDTFLDVSHSGLLEATD